MKPKITTKSAYRSISHFIAYVVFILASLGLYGSIRNPDNIQTGPLGGTANETQRIVHWFVLAVVAVGSGYLSVKALKRDIRFLRNRTRGR